MLTALHSAMVFNQGTLARRDVTYTTDGTLRISSLPTGELFSHFPLASKLVTPGLVDVHVHLREPGFFYKETLLTGTAAAARGGYTAVCAMPNLNPPPDSPEHVKVQQDQIDRTALIPVYPYGCITMGQKGEGTLCDYEAFKEQVIAFSDDGRGVQSESTMRAAMEAIAKFGGLLAAHCEDNALLNGGYIHDGDYAKAHGHRGISSESEWGQVKRDLHLAKETGCRYHVCHVSTKESVALIRQAKREGVDVTCETAPHYLLLCDDDLQEDGRFKMNPPLRSKEDRDALIAGLLDGTIDIIATDHAPHSAEEKSRGLEKSLMGVVGLECAFPALYTGLVKPGIAPLERILTAMTDAPRKRFGLPERSMDNPIDYAIFDLTETYEIDPSTFASMGRSTPFAGMRVQGRCEMTVVGGKAVWQR
ncbi:MAG: dihydroorotase [Eubacteriales bacterium]|nr:dihydroorotase [Eubacteriales bacterium]